MNIKDATAKAAAAAAAVFRDEFKRQAYKAPAPYRVSIFGQAANGRVLIVQPGFVGRNAFIKRLDIKGAAAEYGAGIGQFITREAYGARTIAGFIERGDNMLARPFFIKSIKASEAAAFDAAKKAFVNAI